MAFLDVALLLALFGAVFFACLRMPTFGVAAFLTLAVAQFGIARYLGDHGDLTMLSAAEDTFFLALVAASLSRVRREGFRAIAPTPFHKAALAGFFTFIAAGVMSGLVRGVPLRILGEGAYVSSKGLIIFFSVGLLAKHLSKRGLIWWGAGLALVIWATASAQWVWPDQTARLGLSHEGRFGWVVPGSVFGYSSLFAWFLAFATCIALAWAIAEGRRRAYGIAALLAITAVGTLRARVMISLPIVFLVAFLLLWKRRPQLQWPHTRLVALLIFLVIATTGLVSGVPQKLLSARLSNIAGEDSEAVRGALYKTSFEIAANRFPLGEGFGRFGSRTSWRYPSPVYEQTGLRRQRGFDSGDSMTPNYALDTQWPMFLGEVGVVGTAGFVLVLMSILVGLLRGSMGTWAFAGVLVLIESTVESVALQVHVGLPSLFVFTVLALGLAQAAERTRTNSAS